MEKLLNVDALRIVFSFLTEGKDLARAGMVCKTWYEASSDDKLWQRISFAQKNHWAIIPNTLDRFGSYKAFFR